VIFGGTFVFAGLASSSSMVPDELGARIVVTLGSGVAAFALG
jgi:hypothetical protein